MKTWHLLIETQVGDLNFCTWTFFPIYTFINLAIKLAI